MADQAPSLELCFQAIDHWSTCMTKSEWSGWVQAVGSVLALLGIWYTIRKQRQLTLEAEAREAESEKRAALTDASSAIAVVSAIAEQVDRAAADSDLMALRVHHVRLADGLHLSQAVRLDCLPLEARGAVISVRSAAAILSGAVELVLNNADPDRARITALEGLKVIVRDLLPKLDAHALTVGALE